MRQIFFRWNRICDHEASEGSMAWHLNIELFQGVLDFFSLSKQCIENRKVFSIEPFCFYCVYVFKTAIWLILNKQVSKIWCWVIVAANVCECVYACPTLFRLTEFHVRQGNIKPVQSAESPGIFLESCTDLPWFHSKCQTLGRKQKRESPSWLQDWDVAPFQHMAWNRDWHSRTGFHLSQAVGNGNRQREEKCW